MTDFDKLGEFTSSEEIVAPTKPPSSSPVGAPPISREEYVKAQMEQTERYIARMLRETVEVPGTQSKLSRGALEERRRRAERYARWRYDEFCAGEIKTL